MDKVTLTGSTVVITGANAGIGQETARELARRGARVIMACRNEEKANAAREEIVNETHNDNVVVKRLDLSSLQSIKQFADDFCLSEDRLDILVNNAGVMTSTRETTADGFEMDFGVNHIGHFYLTNLLLDKLKHSAPSRIVTVSSKMHEFYSLDFNDLQFERGWKHWKAYSRSKTANVLFSVHLAKLLQGSGVTTYSLHPGTVDTELLRNVNDSCFVQCFRTRCFQCCLSCFGENTVSAKEGARTSLFCCLEPSISNDTGLYYEKCRRKTAKRYATDAQLAERLWKYSSDLCKLD